MARIHALLLVLVISAAFAGCMVGERPTEPDADADGLPDRIENDGWNITVTRSVAACFAQGAEKPPAETRFVRSNWLREDTDGDGVEDKDEFEQRSDPNVTDTDGDNLTDAQEFSLRTGGSGGDFAYPSRIFPNVADSDDDCLSDGAEVRGFDIPGIGHRATDPTLVTSDADPLTDAWEVFRSHTDPLNPDTDGDGANDRFDADPLRDLYLRLDLERVRLKSSPDGSSGLNLALDWKIPTHPGQAQRNPIPFFAVQAGQAQAVPANNTPGVVDLEDNQGPNPVQIQLVAYQMDGAGRVIRVLALNPWEPGQVVTLFLNVTGPQWAFRTDTATDARTPYGTQAFLETDTMRLEFAIAVQGPPL